MDDNRCCRFPSSYPPCLRVRYHPLSTIPLLRLDLVASDYTLLGRDGCSSQQQQQRLAAAAAATARSSSSSSSSSKQRQQRQLAAATARSSGSSQQRQLAAAAARSSSSSQQQQQQLAAAAAAAAADTSSPFGRQSVERIVAHGHGQRPASGGQERRTTPPVEVFVRPVAPPVLPVHWHVPRSRWRQGSDADRRRGRRSSRSRRRRPLDSDDPRRRCLCGDAPTTATRLSASWLRLSGRRAWLWV